MSVGQTWNNCDREQLHHSEENTEANIYNPDDSYSIDMCMEAMNVHSSSILHEATEQLFCLCYYLNIFFWRVCY
jgi:hypothetical protein